jgi:cytochrome P450
MQILIVAVGSVLVLLSLRYLLMVRAARQAMARKEAPIVPHFVPFVGFALEFATPESRIALVSRLRAEYGPAFRLVMAGRCVLLVADLDLWRLVLRSAGTQAGVADAFSESVLKGFEPFISPKEAASSQRDAAHMKAIRSEIQNPEGVLLMSERAQRCIIGDCEALAGTTHSLAHFGTRILFRATVAALFGNALVAKLCDDDVVCANLIKFDQSMNDRFQGLPRWASKAKRESDPALALAMKTLFGRIADERDERAPVMVGAAERVKLRIERGEAEDVDEFGAPMVILWVAVVNSFGAMLYVLWHLAHDLPMQRRVAAEVRAVLAEENRPDGLLSPAGLARLPLIDSVMAETMRFHGSGLNFRRTGDEAVESLVAKSTVVDGATIELRNVPAKCEILTLNALYFGDPARFDNPREWRGDRFLDSKESHSIVDIVFGGGAHMCPGRAFVKNEVRQVVASLLAKFEITLVGGCTTTPPVQANSVASVLPPPVEGSDAQLLFTKRV